VVHYTMDTNDMRFATVGGFSTGGQWEAHCRDAFDVLWREGEEGSPKMLSIGLHGRIIGRPGRTAALERLLDHIVSRPRVWITRRIDIANHWAERHPPGDRGQRVKAAPRTA
jgi:allantoinase